MSINNIGACSLKARFDIVSPITEHENELEYFIHGALMSGSYKQIISMAFKDHKVIFDDLGDRIVFMDRGVVGSPHAIVIVNSIPRIVNVVFSNKEKIRETIEPHIEMSQQGFMELSASTGNSKITMSSVIFVNTYDYSIDIVDVEYDPTLAQSFNLLLEEVTDFDNTKLVPSKSEFCYSCKYKKICNNEKLVPVTCQTCAFFNFEGRSCTLNMQTGVSCANHLYNPNLMVNHAHISINTDELYIQYKDFVNSNNPVAFKESLTSREMLAHHRFNRGDIMDIELHSLMKTYGAKIAD